MEVNACAWGNPLKIYHVHKYIVGQILIFFFFIFRYFRYFFLVFSVFPFWTILTGLTASC